MTVEKVLYESIRSRISYVPESKWGQPVLRKSLNYEFPTPREIAKFYTEHDITEGLNLPGVRRTLGKEKIKNRHSLILEWIDAPTLADLAGEHQHDVTDVLHLAVSLSDALRNIHESGIIHRDISPYNILVDLPERRVTVIDFGISTRINLKEQNLGNPERLEGNLRYISPEQTGRMNRVVDYRTDLYSAGVVFYEMLTGCHPFDTHDPLELVHRHIAQRPVPVNTVNPEVPEQLSRLVDRLLAKNAEDRYQSARGLHHDLCRCLKAHTSGGGIGSFPLGENDHSGKFQLVQKLYGREREVTELLRAFERVGQGKMEVVLVAGYSGTGKSALVREVHKPITRARGYFIEGKFDQFQRAVPYFALIEAFTRFVDLILTEKEERLAGIRDNIQAAVGTEGRVLTAVIPNLELVIGPQPEVPELGGSESQNRFNYVFRKFVQTISSADQPIVLFIDDLQWADSASLGLLRMLLTDIDNRYILCIGAYRDNEVSASHPFIQTINEVREAGATVSTIEIGNLSREDVSQLIGDATAVSPEKADELTKLVYEKTRGNAFFTTQFLHSLYEEGWLSFDHQRAIWDWNATEIQALNITDNVVELMAGKIRKLPGPTQELLKVGSSIGSSFRVETLALIEGTSEREVTETLFAALYEGLIVPDGEDYSFAHDRIQQAVYSLIPPAESAPMHARIGRLLLSSIPEAEHGERLFDIANQLNRGLSAITDPEERLRLVDLNLAAGRRAKQASAFRRAAEYLQVGIDLLPENHWQEHYALSRDLHTEAAECNYLSGEFATMDALIKEVLDHARALLDKVAPYEIRILSYKAKNQLHEAIDTGLEVLAQLGERFPKKPRLPHVMADLLRTKLKLYGKDVDALEQLPVMVNPEKIAAMRIIADIASSSYWARPNLFPLVIFRMCHMSLRYGNTALSAFAFATYGVIMCGVLEDMKSGYRYGKLGLALMEKFEERAWTTQIYCPVYALIINWNEHVRNTLRPLQESYHIGLETGAIEFACINSNIYCIHSYLIGRPLPRIEEETAAYSRSYRQLKQETNFNYNEVYRQGMLNFMGKSANPLILTGTAYDEEKMTVQNAERKDQTGTFFIHFNKLILGCHFRDYANAAVHAERCRDLLEAVLAKFEIPNHHFYEALVYLSLYRKADATLQRKYMRRAKANIRKMRKWARDAPENYRHKADLMEAERYRVQGRFGEARLAYDRAIAGAAANDYLHEAALAYELAGRAYLNEKFEKLAEFYIKSAYSNYREWGAEAKLKDLERRYPSFVSATGRLGGSATSGTHTLQSFSDFNHTTNLDLQTVLKAATSISGEIQLGSMLNNLMSIVIENAGADEGVLLLKRDDRLLVQAAFSVEGAGTQVLQAIPVEQSDLVAQSVVEFVSRTRRPVVIDDAANDERFAHDPHLSSEKSRSVLCLPFVNQGKFVGILYLENKLATGVFTPERIDLLALLSGQIAISIDNALLYENLEEKVRERTEELAVEKAKSDDLLLNILPQETAEELKQFGRTVPRRFDSVTVMFTDFKGFTYHAEGMTAEELVSSIDVYFRAFDEIIGRHNIEKIKTIGDAYMCVGGLPTPNDTHAVDMVNAAIEIQAWTVAQSREQKALGLPHFELRIGLHSGPVVAGVVGQKKFAYDIWGDTVNTAARMESSGIPGKINISGTTRDLIAHRFNCVHRGKVAAKNKGEIDMYFVKPDVPSTREAYSHNYEL
ncbi:putative ATPase/class 3 adenylate cyclase/putative methionine-R-sulfoxide reductase with GAF domain [Lewinella aquimaris]|uniref:Putative ATPase/class 3 adenylate cyclase/putative methionine-R-sulfoxide reductase with GAF domain n=1 Tax=Neolewinella aquimaris TaxID=1835722 RepID=A0A840E1J4_9BACT|nr:adenylate/guanylate cyclase domain-containing protein [Neolewinella aquimaris]MBB4078980.1 putative ATPase/class 3 adenylate cyclase/putative methionine-R-sulfoxide reductase with GAF domain [Neolewinella aquimaris]